MSVKDGRVISLIHKYLYAGVLIDGMYHPTSEGTPQGGPLSPLLSNIVLNELDKELERRKQVLHETIRGWVGYFKMADMKATLEEIDKWLRRRIRMCVWKAWKHPKTRAKNLIKCGIKPYWARIYGHLCMFNNYHISTSLSSSYLLQEGL